MTNIQKVCCVVLSLCFFGTLAVTPGPFFLRENVYRQLPLYCFLEENASRKSRYEDWETYEEIIEENGEYLGEKAWEEQKIAEGEKAKQNKNQDITDDRKNLNNVEENGKESQDSNVMNNETEQQTDPNIDKSFDEQQEETKTQQNQETNTAKNQANVENQVNAENQTNTENTGNQINTENQENTENDTGTEEMTQETLAVPHPVIDLSPERLADFDYLLGQFYIVDQDTQADASQLNAAEFLAQDLKIEKKSDTPQILIYHSHSQEAFADSRDGEEEDTIVGVGNYLTQILTETYGYQVVHLTEAFDMESGEMDRSAAYDYAGGYLSGFLEENPGIEVVIDLHRDGVSDDRHLVTEINGKQTAQIMFYNGLSYTLSKGTLDYLPNPYIQENLAFSFQLEYQAAEYYPDFYRGIYLAGYRYNQHFRPRSILLEAGAQTNTVQEVKNAMEPFAFLLDKVLSG